MKNKSISLKQAVDFHGHLGPFLILGLKMGECALRKLKAKRYFGLSVFVYGAMERPKSCLIDGLQLATGATFGKGNISKLRGTRIEVVVQNKNNKRGIRLGFKNVLIKKLKEIETHEESEVLAKELYRTASSKLFEINSRVLNKIRG